MYRFINDPGHGWLEVPVSELAAYGVSSAVSRYSYVDRKSGYAYLEEDCDAPLFLEAFRARNGMAAPIRETYCHGRAFVRDLASYGSKATPRDSVTQRHYVAYATYPADGLS